jgi:impB/mucB/samB family
MSAESSTLDEGAKHAHLFVFAGANKAGMEACDKEKQARVIYEMSKNSAYYKRQLEQDEKINKKVDDMKAKIAGMSRKDVISAERVAIDRVMETETRRSFNRICCVLDMDMFFAAVEIRDCPELKDKPVAVGGMSMISTTNYVARKFGVRAAMPGFIGIKVRSMYIVFLSLCMQHIALRFCRSHSRICRTVSHRIVPDIIRMYSINIFFPQALSRFGVYKAQF